MPIKFKLSDDREIEISDYQIQFLKKVFTEPVMNAPFGIKEEPQFLRDSTPSQNIMGIKSKRNRRIGEHPSFNFPSADPAVKAFDKELGQLVKYGLIELEPHKVGVVKGGKTSATLGRRRDDAAIVKIANAYRPQLVGALGLPRIWRRESERE